MFPYPWCRKQKSGKHGHLKPIEHVDGAVRFWAVNAHEGRGDVVDRGAFDTADLVDNRADGVD